MKGSGTGTQTRIDATGTATGSEAFGAKVPQVAYDVHLQNGVGALQSLTFTARGEGRGLEPQPNRGRLQTAALPKTPVGNPDNTHLHIKSRGLTHKPMHPASTRTPTH